MLFTSINDLEGTPAIVRAVKDEAAKHGRDTDVYVQTQIVCRPTGKEAEDFYHYFAEEQADQDALEYYRKKRVINLSKGMKASEIFAVKPNVNRITRATGKRYSGTFPGVYPVVGSPDDIVDELIRLKATGIGGSALIFLNYLQELPYFVQEVLPRMERAGLRQPAVQRAA
jgi:alkanesulfonate monooxygenase SsuD/methylene tetrahydromethanopterin reductase-like flavin-dependent oxidoreductase (luciferase family)